MTITTLNDVLFYAVETYRKKDALKYKKDGVWIDISSQELGEKVQALSLGLIDLGIAKGDRIALLSETRAEWLISDLAIITAGGVTVPVYPSLPADQAEYILNDSKAKLIIVSTQEHLKKIQGIKANLPQLKHIIVIETVPNLGGETLSFDQVMLRGQEQARQHPELHRQRASAVKPDDLATIIYTSGTTGTPKGVMLRHSNVLSNAQANTQIIKVDQEDIALSFLPLSHILEKMPTYGVLQRGGTIAYAESMDTVAQNLQEISPTMMVAVPRFFEKLYARIKENVKESSFLKRSLFAWAIKIGQRYSQLEFQACLCPVRGRQAKSIPLGLRFKHWLVDKLVFSKIRKKMGGRLRFMVSGGAALPKELGEFFYIFGLKVLEGYGLTETSPVIAINTLEHFKFGTVGKVIPGVEVKIAEDGEILAKGPNVMIGYYHMPEETQAVLKDGWFHTGDIGQFDAEGFLVITDRKKDLIKTSGGKYVAPQPLENQLGLNTYISTAVVVGNKRRFVSVLIVPDFVNLEKYAREQGISFVGRSDLLRHPEIEKFFQTQINRLNAGRASFETIKKFILIEQDFTIESGEITPTMKVKRRIVEGKYKGLIDKMYEES